MNDLLTQLDQRNAAGLALLPTDQQVLLQDTPEEFRRVLGASLFDLHAGAESDYVRGIDFGRALGILTAGAALELISHKQQEALMAALTQVKPQ